MKKIHIALGVADIEASVRDYSVRFQCSPEVLVPNEYALWRTPIVNFSIRKASNKEVGTLRHLGWEDASAAAFSVDTDVNGIVWESFAADQQRAEIESLWGAEVLERASSSCEQNMCVSLDEVRTRIDGIDRQIVALLAERGAFVKQAARFKSDAAEVAAPERVKQVIAKVTSLADQLGADPGITEQVYQAMIAGFIALETQAHAALAQSIKRQSV